jgi:hypothetical protein
MNYKFWFDNCGGFTPLHSLQVLRDGIKRGLKNIQDEDGCTALLLCSVSKWYEGAEELLRAGANTELRYFRTGTTVLYDATQSKDQRMIKLLVEAGANPDAPNYWGLTPRTWRPDLFTDILLRPSPHPEPHIQNAEHLADNFENFEIPELSERVSLKPGQAVHLYVYGPKNESKDDQVKVRIISRFGEGRETCYTAKVETPIEKTHLIVGTTQLEFGPEHVATVYYPHPDRKK